MNKQQASEVVRGTFASAFDKPRFGQFALNILNRLDDSKAQQWTTQYIKDAFKEHVHRYERLGTYTAPDDRKLDVLIVHLAADSKLERARTAARNFVADHLKKRDEKDAALVAFVSPSEQQWRFSYVKMEYATVEKDTGKIGVEERLTPARRFSYLVGEGESCHTAQTRFLGLLQETDKNPRLEDIEEAFSVEAVTDEFFERYVELFEDIHAALDKLAAKDKVIRDEFKSMGVSTVDFAKKLLGQIVFLYFLQKKGWLGVEKGKEWGSGPRNFLRRLANGEYGKYKNFFNDVLEPLFYDTLATDRGHEAWCKNFKCRIPFLNGGLFEPIAGYDWQKTDIVLPNDLFTNDEAVEEGIVGTGVLDVFDRYNFTVNESEPLEKEVAIDPEMLGKVFENLIEDNRRKGLGAFYTPREIVHFMCQESLINYLDTALNGVPAPIQAKTESQGGLFGAEPAQMTLPSAGKKGALPREDIETFIRLGEQISHYESVEADYRVKMPKSIEKNAKALDDALKSITVCDPAVGSGAFPVGMLTEIIRARLSLTPYFNEAGERTPYHFKRHAIQNCLYGVDIDSGAVEIAKLRLWLSLVVDEEDVKQIKPLPNLDYKIVSGNSLLCVEKDLFNLQLFQKLEELKTRYFDQTDHAEKSSIRTQINHIINQLTNGRAAFDFEIYYSEVFHAKRGFDVVIMNPPYGAEFSEDENKYLKNKYDHIVERIRNSFLYFMGLGYDIARHGGIVSTIEPNEFLFQIYMTKARRYFVGNAQILYAINTGEDVFKAIVPTCVLALRKLKMGSYKIPIADLRGCTLGELPHRLKTNDFAATSSDIVLGTPNSIFAFDLDSASLVNKLSESCTAFEMFCDDVANGISTSCDNIYIVPKEHAERERYEKEYVKPCIRGGQFNRYYCPADTGDRILYVTDEYVTKEGRRILKYLTEHKSLLIEKCVEKKQGKREWHVLFRGRYEELFKAPKIMIRQTADKIIAALDTSDGYYCIDSVNVALLKMSARPHMKYLLGLLNSKVVNFFYREISQEGGRVLAQVKPLRIRALPIAAATPEKQKVLEHIVDRILAAKQKNVAADTSAWEREIDLLAYQLYGLTKGEIAIVEKST